ncbi:hypothetical protein Tco_1218449 [Tanacetum coccineum]
MYNMSELDVAGVDALDIITGNSLGAIYIAIHAMSSFSVMSLGNVNEARDTVMSSDSASSEVTYTSISSHRDPLAWVVEFFRLQEPDSPEAAPASLDYVPGPEEPEQAPL